MFVAFRALTYATCFIALLLIYLPVRLLTWSGIRQPAAIHGLQVLGILIGTAGAAIAVSCIVAFVTIGQGTPAPFDPPRRLVIRGPYRFVRNPMYIGAAMALGGAALYYKSVPLLTYICLFMVVAHLFVIAYEEPTLKRTFGPEYETYCHCVRRWWPRMRAVTS